MTREELYDKARELTMEPGVYIMLDKRDGVIYVGKAKRLKNRVTSYFRPGAQHLPKVEQMVQHADHFRYIVTASEEEALLLECSLIKQYKPKYNILLKDDKGYSYIKISPPPYSKLTAEYKNDTPGEYMGPYHSSFITKQTVGEANRIFKLPTCRRPFPASFRKERPCLNYYIGRCMGVCRGRISEQEYDAVLADAVRFLKGGSDAVMKEMERAMTEAADREDFELAAVLRDRIRAIKDSAEEQNVVDLKLRRADYIGCAADEGNVCFAVIKVRDGRVRDKKEHVFEVERITDELVADFLLQFYLENQDIPPVICAPPCADLPMLQNILSEHAKRKISLSTPKRGERVSLYDMAVKNAAERLASESGKTGKTVRAMSELATLLGLPKVPSRIESIDISNYGAQTVLGGLVCFVDGQPYKKGYRTFLIKSVQGTDDPRSVAEVARRRITRFLDGDERFSPLPDVLLLDGGKTQLAAVRQVLKELQVDLPVFGMVKDSHHRTRGLVSDGGELSVPVKSAAFTFMNQLQNEVHRFSLNAMRKRHFKTTTALELTKVPGIGEKRATALLKAFGSMKNLRAASVEELSATGRLPQKLAQAVYDFLKEDA